MHGAGTSGAAEITGWRHPGDFARWMLWIDDPGPFDVAPCPRDALEGSRLVVALPEHGPAPIDLRILEGRAPVRIVLRPLLAW